MRRRRRWTNQRLGRPLPRGLAQAERGGDRRRHETGIDDRCELDEHRLTRPPVARRRLDRESRLAGSRRSGQRQESNVGSAEQRADLPQLLLTAHEGGRARGQARRRSAGCGDGQLDRASVELRILVEDRPFEASQRRPGLDSELLDERLPRRPIGRQRVGLPARAIEREHQLAAKSLAQRVLGDKCFELGNELGVRDRAARSASIRSSSASSRSSSSRRDLGLRPRLEREIDERRPSPQRESLVQPVARNRRLRPSRLVEEPLEPVRVQAVALEAKLVAGRTRHDRAIAEHLAKLRDIRLQGLERRCRRPTPHRSAISRSVETGRSPISRIASSARGFAARSETRRPSASTSSGPRI